LLKQYIGDGFNLITADSGKAALAAMARTRFDFVFLDSSLPDMNAMDVYEAFAKTQGSGSSTTRVAVMPLRTAQGDIDSAQSHGLKVFLYKPFSQEDVTQLVSNLAPSQQKSSQTKFLTAMGDIRVLPCPHDKSPMFRIYAGAITTNIRKEIDEMVEEGFTKLIIEVHQGLLSDMAITRKFIDLVEHAANLSMTIRFAAETPAARDALKQFAETASFPIDVSIQGAIGSMA